MAASFIEAQRRAFEELTRSILIREERLLILGGKGIENRTSAEQREWEQLTVCDTMPVSEPERCPTCGQALLDEDD